jgi:hypothetical protein
MVRCARNWALSIKEMAIQMFVKTAEEQFGHVDNVANGVATGYRQLEP